MPNPALFGQPVLVGLHPILALECRVAVQVPHQGAAQLLVFGTAEAQPVQPGVGMVLVRFGIQPAWQDPLRVLGCLDAGADELGVSASGK